MKWIKNIKNSALARSFRMDKKFWCALLFDFFFILSLLLIIALFALALNAVAQAFSRFDALLPDIAKYLQNENIGVEAVSKAGEAQGLIVGFIVKMVLLIVLAFLLYVASLSYFEGKSWGYVDGKFNFKKLFLLNLTWNFLWLLFLILLVFLIKAEMLAYFIMAAAMLYSYFSQILFCLNCLADGGVSGSVLKNVWRAFAVGITRFYLLLIPFAIIILMLLAGLSAIYLLTFKILIIYNILSMAFLLFMFTWIKFYVFNAMEKILKH